MDKRIYVWLIDIKRAIEEVETFFENYPMDYTVFEKDFLRRRAVERNAEIMGEAINRIFKADPSFPIPEGKEVIKTRNRIIHAYDSVRPEFLWGLVIRHIPVLKKDIERLIQEELEKGNPEQAIEK